MRSIVVSIYLTLLSSMLLGQQDFVLQRDHAELELSELVEQVESKCDLKFYYQKNWVDSIVFSNIEAGTSVVEILSRGLKKHGLIMYTRGNQIFIYPGQPIISELPELKNNTVTLSAPGPVKRDTKAGNDYISTKEIMNENIIEVGNERNNAGQRKCKISGTILNRKENELLVGATIYIKELEYGAVSDASGRFELYLLPGEYRLSADHMAMKETQYLLKVFSDGELYLELEDKIIELQEITISSDRYDNVSSLQMGYDRISIKAMKEIPIVMGEKDVLQVAQMLPGVQNIGEGSSGFNVRGGSTDQNMFYINNISVYNTAHLFGFFTAFNPDVINDFTLYKNNIPTKYGGRIASVFDISTRQGNKNEFFIHGGISPVTGHFSLEGPVIKEKVSVVASFRSTYSDWLLKRMNDQDLRESSASFYDATLGANAEINENNKLKLFFYQSADKFSLSSRDDYSYSNTGASINWNHSFTPHLSLETSFAHSNYQFQHINKNNISEAYTQNYTIQHNEFRTDFLLLRYENHRIDFGLNSILYNLDRGSILPFGEESTRTPVLLGKENGLENALYISDEIKVLPKLSLLLGLRYSFYSQLGPADLVHYLEDLPKETNNISSTSSYEAGELIKWYSGLEPRLALNYRFNTYNSVKASYNRLNQYIFLLSNTIAIAPTDQWKLVDYHIVPPVADQVSLGYYKDSKDKEVSVSLELYKKWGNNIVDYKNGADFISGLPVEQMVLQGKQNSYGAEFMLKKNSNRLTGWLSYTYARSLIQMNGMHAVERINNGYPYPSNYDRPHSVNLVANLRLKRRFSFSSNLVYSTGRPITLPVGIYYAEGQQLLLYSDRNQYRIPDYFRIDFSVNVEGNLKFRKLGHSYWMLNVYNLTGRENAYSVFYKAENRKIKGYKLSIFARPIVTLSWHLKLGNYSND